jgi:uncharacterized membrane protein
MKSLAYEREEMRVNITNYTRYNSDDLVALVKDMAPHYALPRSTDVFHIVVDTYRPAESHVPIHEYVDGVPQLRSRPQWVNISNHEGGELRIVPPDRMPVPTPESLAIMGSTDPSLPGEAVLAICMWAANHIAASSWRAGWKYGTAAEVGHGQTRLLSNQEFAERYSKENNPQIRIEKSVETKRPKVSRKRYSWAEKKLYLTARAIRTMEYQVGAGVNEIESHLANTVFHLEKVGAVAEIKQLEKAKAFLDKETENYKEKLAEFQLLRMRVSAGLSDLSRGGK